jgi:O-antigen ligase/tetratricopeptide (TPR) repeat protein
MSRVGVGLAGAVLIAAPLVVGGVHRVPMILLMLVCALAVASLAFGGGTQRPLRVGAAVVLPLVLLAIPLLQALPLPMALRGLLDPNGNALLADNDLTTLHFWPLSLDPVVTREYVGKAAAAVALFMIAYHLASGQTRRHVIPRIVGLTGVAAVFIGLGHHILGFTEIYGLFASNPRSLLTGPFVNANHTAEFLELATFACLACAFQRDNILNRYGWFTGALLCAVGAIATLSRGALLGLVVGAVLFVLLRRAATDAAPRARRGAAVAWAVAVVLLVGATAAALGAGGLVDRLRTTSLADEVRLHLWRDAFRVLAAHPVGIGRGAFDRVYPIYRTVETWAPITFAYLENHPLQLLVDSGWLLFAAVVVAVGLVVREVVRHGRRDRIEAAFLAGLAAVVAHSFLDFALETMGAALPFAAILGTVMGRCRPKEGPPASQRAVWALVAVTCASLTFSAVSIARPSDDDFDKLLKRAHGLEESRAVLVRAQLVHPTDYFYAFAYARTAPVKLTGGRSPRLHALNRAMRLCPGCEQVHAEAARTLWRMGLHSQALVEWRAAVRNEPTYFKQALDELWRSGAKATELAGLASFDAAKMVEAADFLSTQNQLKAALTILDEADLLDAPRAESLLTRCGLQIRLGQLDAAATTLAEARAAGIQDPRLAVLEANLVLGTRGAAGAGDAFAILDLAATRYPLDVPVQRLRISLVSTYAKWQAADRAIDGFKLALYRATGSAVEANLAAARIRAQLSQWNACFSEYRTALAQDGGNVWTWYGFGQTAEQAGRDSTAREAYAEAARLLPTDQNIATSLRRVEARQGYLRGPSAPGLIPNPGR